MSFVRNTLALACAVVVACAESGCGGQPVLTNPALAQSPKFSNGIENLANELQSKRICFIHHQNMTMTSAYVGPDGRAMALTAAQCEQANEDVQTADAQAQEDRAAAAQRAQQDAIEEQGKAATAAADAAQKETAAGYSHVTIKGLYLDGKTFAANATKIAVSGFYKLHGRHDERLYGSYDDLMMHSYQADDALYVGVLTDDGSRNLREYLMRCVAGCNVTILGHVSQCVATNVFGAKSQDVCLVADDMRAP